MAGFEVTLDIPLHCEDAPSKVGPGYMIVCDGLGSGALKVEYNGEVHTSAYYASRVVSETASLFVESNRDRFFDGDVDGTVSDLKAEIQASLSRFVLETGIDPEGIGGNLFRILPTTLACIVYREIDGMVDAQTIWAGDSRCYCMDPIHGLRQISDDDIKAEKDPMGCLLEDTPMSNVICFDKDFHINHVRHSFDNPCLLFVASDGCFAYLDSPMSFERLFLPSGSVEDFNLEAQLDAMLSIKKFDDRSLAGVCFGIANDEAYAETFSERAKKMQDECFSKMVYDGDLSVLRDRMKAARSLPKGPERTEAMTAVRAELAPIEKVNENLMVELWDGYKGSYDSLRSSYHASRVKEAIIERSEKSIEGAVGKALREYIRGTLVGSTDDSVTFAAADSTQKSIADSASELIEGIIQESVREAVKGATEELVDDSRRESAEKSIVDASVEALKGRAREMFVAGTEFVSGREVRKATVSNPDARTAGIETEGQIDTAEARVRSMGRVGGIYVIDRSTIRDHGYYLDARATADGRSNKRYRVVFKPISEYDSKRAKFVKSREFTIICSNSHGLQAPLHAEVTSGMLITVFSEVRPERCKEYGPADICRLKDRQFLDMAISLMEVVGQLHYNNLVHGDISPENVWIWRRIDNGQFRCRINNYSRMFLKSGVYCDIDLAVPMRSAAYDSERLAVPFARMPCCPPCRLLP